MTCITHVCCLFYTANEPWPNIGGKPGRCFQRAYFHKSIWRFYYYNQFFATLQFIVTYSLYWQNIPWYFFDISYWQLLFLHEVKHIDKNRAWTKFLAVIHIKGCNTMACTFEPLGVWGNVNVNWRRPLVICSRNW